MKTKKVRKKQPPVQNRVKSKIHVLDMDPVLEKPEEIIVKKKPIRKVKTRTEVILPKPKKEYSSYSINEQKTLINRGKDKHGNVVDSIIPLNDIDSEMQDIFNEYVKQQIGKDRKPDDTGKIWKEIIAGEKPKLDPNDDLVPARMLKKFQRPYFSPKLNSYEVDLAFFKHGNRTYNYLFVININTRKLYVIPIGTKDTYDLKVALSYLINKGVEIDNFRSDEESGLKSENMQKFLKEYRITHFHSKSPYTQKNRIVDRCIRTIRDWLDRMKNPTNDFDKNVQLVVYLYNNTFHSSIGMKPVEMTYELEHDYIENCKRLLMNVKELQHMYGFHNYKPGQTLKIYLDNSKTLDRFKKKRRHYHTIGTFIEYVNGNVKCKIGNQEHIVPVYYTVTDEIKNKIQSQKFERDNRIEDLYDEMKVMKVERRKHIDNATATKRLEEEQRYVNDLKQWEQKQLEKQNIEAPVVEKKKTNRKPPVKKNATKKKKRTVITMEGKTKRKKKD